MPGQPGAHDYSLAKHFRISRRIHPIFTIILIQQSTHETSVLIAAAEQMPEEFYGYRPTEEVRTFGQIVDHVANALYMFCGTASGGEARGPENFEERTSRAGLVEAIKLGFSQCDAAYAMDDMKAMEEVEFFGQTGTRLWVMTFNLAHNWEHYGNLVTYMRANGLVPPSSQGGNLEDPIGEEQSSSRQSSQGRAAPRGVRPFHFGPGQARSLPSWSSLYTQPPTRVARIIEINPMIPHMTNKSGG